MTERRIGFIGVGTMGSRMVPHLLAAGHVVHVHDIDAKAVDTLARAHNDIAVEDSPRAVAASCGIAITMLPAGADVRRAALGADGLAEGFAEGGVLVDMGSSEPWLTTALAAELAGRGIAMIDAPVSGGVGGAEGGTLTVMVGGEDAVVERCLPFLEPLAGTVFRTGAVGSGHAMKTLNNLLSGIHLLTAAEALLVGSRFGLDPEVMIDVINESTGMSAATRRNFRQHVFSRRFEGGFPYELRFKDLGIALQLARETRTPVPLSGLCYQIYEAARGWLGPGADNTDIVRWVEHLAGTELDTRK